MRGLAFERCNEMTSEFELYNNEEEEERNVKKFIRSRVEVSVRESFAASGTLSLSGTEGGECKSSTHASDAMEHPDGQIRRLGA